MKESIPISGIRLAVVAAFLGACVLEGGCRSEKDRAPQVRIARVPDASPGGPEKLDYIQGTVTNAKAGQYIVIYAHSGVWWVQPFVGKTTTNVLPDGSWKNSTHLGTDYAAGSGYAAVPRRTVQNCFYIAWFSHDHNYCDGA